MNGHPRRPAKGQVFVIGVGASGPTAAVHARRAVELLRAHPSLALKSASRFYGNPPTGGATTARFLNGAVVVETALAPAALLIALRGVEHEVGRVRGRKNAARAIDLDVLLAPAVLSSTGRPTVPHPRLYERAFAVVPAEEALRRAGGAVPAPVARAALGMTARATLRAEDLPAAVDPALVASAGPGDAPW